MDEATVLITRAQDMKILQINAVYKTTSTGRIAMEMHKAFQERGLESYVGYAIRNTDTSGDPNVFRIGNTIDHKIHALAYRIDHMQGCHSTYETKRLLKKIEILRPDVVLTHNLHTNYLNAGLFLNALHEMHIPPVIALHDCWFMTGGCYHFTLVRCNQWLSGCRNCAILGKAAEIKYKRNCEMFDKIHPTVVATSKWIEAIADQSLLGSRSNIHMIYDWIDTETFYPRNPDPIRKKTGIGNRKMILGVATGWSPEKGQNEMISVAAEMPEAVVVLVGHQAVKANYPENVITMEFTDSKDELAELYSAADVFYNPSKQETFGLVSGEALACGTPVVVNNTTACPEFISGNTGMIVDGNLTAKEAIRTVIDKNSHIGREAIRKECREFVKLNFNKNNNIDKYIKLFEDIVKAH